DRAQALGTIRNDDTTLAISDATVQEGDSRTVQAVFNVTLAQPSALLVTVDYATVDGTAMQPDDYLAATGTLSFAPGQTVQQIAVSVNGDTAPEPTETFSVRLSNAVHAGIAA